MATHAGFDECGWAAPLGSALGADRTSARAVNGIPGRAPVPRAG
jgi:hypothetical protein